MNQGVEKLTGGERYFVHLPTKRQRDREEFDKKNAETFRIFGFDQKGAKNEKATSR